MDERNNYNSIPEQPQNKITRFEVIDHTSKKRGRIVVEYDVNVEVSIQDDGRTMKVFLTEDENKKGTITNL